VERGRRAIAHGERAGRAGVMGERLGEAEQLVEDGGDAPPCTQPTGPSGYSPFKRPKLSEPAFSDVAPAPTCRAYHRRDGTYKGFLGSCETRRGRILPAASGAPPVRPARPRARGSCERPATPRASPAPTSARHTTGSPAPYAAGSAARSCSATRASYRPLH
jgi:hypothetical protein